MTQLPKTISHHQFLWLTITTPIWKGHEKLYRLDSCKHPSPKFSTSSGASKAFKTEFKVSVPCFQNQKFSILAAGYRNFELSFEGFRGPEWGREFGWRALARVKLVERFVAFPNWGCNSQSEQLAMTYGLRKLSHLKWRKIIFLQNFCSGFKIYFEPTLM